jgi:hypothetical protein
MDAFGITGGTLPHYRVYDREGNVARTFALDPAVYERGREGGLELTGPRASRTISGVAVQAERRAQPFRAALCGMSRRAN